MELALDHALAIFQADLLEAFRTFHARGNQPSCYSHERIYHTSFPRIVRKTLSQIECKDSVVQDGFVSGIVRYFKSDFNPRLSTLEKWAQVLDVNILIQI